ncbi:MAG: hypothetical protein CK425_12590 [Parachlamydia sp.]|nr:MAG: hypothetical protein CK425_12590 [Parachlamydia sp.]
MKKLGKSVVCATVIAMLTTSSGSLNALEYVTDLGGYGYEEARRAPQIGPAIAFAAIGLATIITLALLRSSSSHAHVHSTSDSR